MMRWCLIFLMVSHTLQAQDSIVNKKKLNVVRYSALSAYAVTMIGLNEVWYSQSPRTSFHFFNDAAQWKQMDKLGHAYSAFQISSAGYQALRWANSKERKRALVSSFAGFAVISSIEIFDGFSTSYGASLTDLTANATGSLLFYSQIVGWKEIRLYPKFSFSRSSMASLRPDVLGDGLTQEIIKDYNGQTYWLCADMDKFVRFPKWLNLAIGYGADQMKYARDSENLTDGFAPVRQFYLSVDFDPTTIPTKSKFVKGLIYFVNMIKLPAPALEFSNGKVTGHWLHF
jgi:hypothetical protein